MAAITCAVMSVAAAMESARQADNALRDMGLKPTRKFDRELVDLYEQMRLHRAKMEAMHAETMRQAKIATFLLCLLVAGIVNFILDVSGYY